MSKKYSAFVTALFCLFIFGFGVVHFILPDRDFSEQENRYLAQFKVPTFKTLRTGQFMEDFEDYVVDQFPLRDSWIQLKAMAEVALGKQENNGVYLGTDGQTLFAQFTAVSQEELAQRVGYVNRLADNVDVPVYFSLIPDKTFAWRSLLPRYAPKVDDGSTISTAQSLCGDNVTYIELRHSLHDSDAFYRTDHHWTVMGANQAYFWLMRNLRGSGWTDREYTLTLQSDSFYGTTWSSSGAGWVQPDSIYSMVPEGGPEGHITVTGYPEGSPVEGGLYHPDKLEVKDKYAFFLGGNQSLCIIRNPDAGDGRLLVIRDSYADALAPFLAQEYQEVHLFDPRYNNMSIRQYVAENGIDQVLVLYAASNFNTDNNLFKLGI